MTDTDSDTDTDTETGSDTTPDRDESSDASPHEGMDESPDPGDSADATHEGSDTADEPRRTTLITSIGESTGKTGIAIALAKHLADGGRSVGYMKPKGTRLESHVGKTLDSDPLLAREILDLQAEVHDMEPVVYSPTFVEEAIRGRENPEELRERVLEAYGRIAAGKDHVLVEGGGSVTTGGVVDLTDADVAEALDARAILVSGYDRAGDVDDVLAAADHLGDSLAGVVFNAVSDAALDQLGSEVTPFLEERGIPVFGILPRVRDLAGVTVGDLADELGAQRLVEGGEEAYVERFSVGAMSAESALQYFRRSKDVAVITGGDRSEIHTAALEAPGVKCLILTGGHRPSGAVLGKAESKGVPVLLVQGDTLSTVERAEAVVSGGRTRDHRTVERMGTLLADHADVEALLGE